MTPLNYEPTAKHQIKDAITRFLYDPVHRHFQQRMDALIMRNTSLGGYSHKSFVYKGVNYSLETGPLPLRKNRLMPQLKGEMESYLADVDRINTKELPFVVGFINQVLNTSPSLVDYMAVLPDVVHSPLQRLAETCPCRMGVLDPERIEAMKAKNQQAIDLIKQRLVLNLII
jgi:hypothetical protein